MGRSVAANLNVLSAYGMATPDRADRISHKSTIGAVCEVCRQGTMAFRIVQAGVPYHECISCGSIAAERSALPPNFEYGADYWRRELRSTRRRSWSSSVQRVGEVFALYGIEIKNLIDISTGGGELLDSLSALLPEISHVFHGIEPFPPPVEFRSKHPGYRVGSLDDLEAKFDAGVCIEVIEHVFPDVLRAMLQSLAARSNPGALYYFNSGQPDFVKEQGYSYLDPTRRGHIASYSLAGMTTLFAEEGFVVSGFPSRNWGFFAEYRPAWVGTGETPFDRLWRPLPENIDLLEKCRFGKYFYSSGREAILAEL
jgi:hypothetical protein